MRSASRLMWPNAFDERRWITGSSTISSVPITMRMISGRKRRASCELNTGLTGTGDLRGLRLCQLNPIRYVDVGLFQNACRVLADGWQEALREDAHPHHHDDERNDRRPLPEVHVVDVVLDRLASLAVE